MGLVEVLGGKFIVEQPALSLLFRHPRFRWLTTVMKVLVVLI